MSAMRHLACPGTPVHAYGVCTAVESKHRSLASRMLRCPACAALHRHLQMAGLPLPSCCAEGAGSAAAWEEDVTGRTFVQVCPILLCRCGQAYLAFSEYEAVMQHAHLLVTGLLQPQCCAESAGALQPGMRP